MSFSESHTKGKIELSLKVKLTLKSKVESTDAKTSPNKVLL